MPRITKAMKLEEAAQEPPSPDNFRCITCGLFKSCTNPFIAPRYNGKIMFVGLGPGEVEDAEGVFFQGSAGKLLKKILTRVGLKKDDVVFDNALKCRPPGNKASKLQIQMCRAFLHRDIVERKPSKIVALGEVAARSVLGIDEPLAVKDYTCRLLQFNKGMYKADVIVTYHPAAALRSNIDYESAIEKHIRDFLSGSIGKHKFPKVHTS